MHPRDARTYAFLRRAAVHPPTEVRITCSESTPVAVYDLVRDLLNGVTALHVTWRRASTDVTPVPFPVVPPSSTARWTDIQLDVPVHADDIHPLLVAPQLRVLRLWLADAGDTAHAVRLPALRSLVVRACGPAAAAALQWLLRGELPVLSTLDLTLSRVTADDWLGYLQRLLSTGPFQRLRHCRLAFGADCPALIDALRPVSRFSQQK